MKIYSFLIALLLTHCSFAQFYGFKYDTLEPADMVVTYELKYQQDSTNPYLGHTKVLLLLGKNISKFVSKASFTIDTASRKFTSDEQVMQYHSNPQVPRSGITYQILKNYPKGKISFIQHIPSETYRFEEELNLFEWEITGDTNTICGYRCQKAACEFGGRSWIAWFSPDLPYSDGPYKFNGLPGLIVKVYDTRNHYDFEMQSVNRLEPPLMMDIRVKDYIVTTREGFFRAEDSFREDIISRASEAGMNNNTQQIAARNMAMRNNPIELKRK